MPFFVDFKNAARLLTFVANGTILANSMAEPILILAAHLARSPVDFESVAPGVHIEIEAAP